VRLTEIHIYPVKSLAGIALQRSSLDAMGLHHDRRWMVVDPAGRFLTQRDHPQMALIQPRLLKGELTLSRVGMPDHRVPPAGGDKRRVRVVVWRDRLEAVHLGEHTDAWLSQAIGTPCKLVYIDDDVVRQCDLNYADEGERTGFADGFPLLLISQASLDDLNKRLDENLPMRRFRPNLVVSGCAPYAEDRWRRIVIGGIAMRVVKPCSRCVITTIDPATGVKGKGEPLRTLSTYRMRGNQVYFGQNLIHEQQGALTVGQELVVQF
jgi:uncharacterized protein